jgi:hypothetical protein
MSGSTHADHQQLVALEQSLWRAEARFDRDHMDELLAPEFAEVGASGRVHSRADILATPAGPIEARPGEIAVSRIGEDVALLTYLTELGEGSDLEQANRSSLWTRVDGRWRLRFHQGTPFAPRLG